MAAHGIGSAVSSIAGLVSGVADGLRALIPVEKKDPMQEMWDFAQWEFTEDDVKQIEVNAKALLGFSTVMAVTKTINVWSDIAELASGIVNFASSFFPAGKDPMIEMKKFAGHKFTIDEVAQITLNAKALLAFSSTMGVAKTMGAVGDITSMFGGIANAVSSLFGFDEKDPMLEMKEFAKHKITQKEADQIGLNASALVKFSTAMALYSAGSAGAAALDLVGSMAKGITKFFGGTTGIDYEEIKKFAESGIDKHEVAITTNARVIGAFSKAMSDHASAQSGVEWKNIGTNILGAVGSIFGGTATDKIPYAEITAFAAVDWGETVKGKVVSNAETLHAYTEAISKMQDIKTSEGFWSSLGSAFAGAFTTLLGQGEVPVEAIKTFAAITWGEDTKKKVVTNAETLYAFTEAMSKMGEIKKTGEFWSSLGSSITGAFSSLLGQDKLPIEQIIEFTKVKLDLAIVENNISAIEAFMNFGTRMKDWNGSDMGSLGDLGKNMTKAAQGIYIAMYGGKNTIGTNYELDPSNSLTQVDLEDFTRVSAGVKLLTSAMGISVPTQQLQAATAAMDASTGNTTIVNAPDNSSNINSSATTNYQDMNVDHDENSGSWWSKVDLTPWN